MRPNSPVGIVQTMDVSGKGSQLLSSVHPLALQGIQDSLSENRTRDMVARQMAPAGAFVG